MKLLGPINVRSLNSVAMFWKMFSGSSSEEKQTKRGSVKTINDILTWREFVESSRRDSSTKADETSTAESAEHVTVTTTPVTDLASKVSCFEGDITTLQIGAIVNAANKYLIGGGGVDGCIHRAAGDELANECKKLNGCETGNAKITKGYNLPCRYVIHAVGPTTEDASKLEGCYKRSFELVKENNIKSVAFPCIATGIYGFPNDKAAQIALQTTRDFLTDKDNYNKIDRVIFCLFTETDKKLYRELMSTYFT